MEFGTYGGDFYGGDAYSSPMEYLDCDYLVIGAGTRGLVFVDSLLSINKTCTVIIADERDSPGGQWHDAPAFARVSQTSMNYGVPSKQLESGEEKKPGQPHERANRAQVLSYYEQVMQDLENTGRVRYFPLCSVSRDGSIMESIVDPDGRWQIEVRNKVVDATFLQTELPAARDPPFKVHEGAEVIPPNGLGNQREARSMYVVIGAGRMGVDTLLHLLELGLPPDRLHWVVPRDFWYANREEFWPENIVNFQLKYMEEFSSHDNIRELYLKEEQLGMVFRLDPDIFPTVYHATFVSPDEFAMLKRIKHVIRMGHVKEVTSSHLVLEEGIYPAKDALHIDCTSSYMRTGPAPVPIWSSKRITMQQVVEASASHGEWNVPMSAAVIGFAEACCENPDKNNERFRPMRWSDEINDWARELSRFYGGVHHIFSDVRICGRVLNQRPSLLAPAINDVMTRLFTRSSRDGNIVKMQHSLKLAMSIKDVDGCGGSVSIATQTDPRH